jgi:hypothetical protein
MIDFFEMLNGCSSLRTAAYLLSILAFTFICFAGINDIITSIFGGKKNKKVKETEDKTNTDSNE